jgi:ferrous iron transport protein A
LIPLGLLGAGEEGVIVVAGGGAGTVDGRAEELGLRVGRRVRMLANGAGPVLVKLDESRIALDRGVAMRIKVRTA